MTKPICLVIGAGAGIGGNVAKKFANEGYHAFLARRSNATGLNDLIKEIEKEGNEASGKIVNLMEEGSIEKLVTDIETDLGPIETAVYNLGAQIGNHTLEETSHKAFEMGWQLGCFGLYRLAHALIPRMQTRSAGNLLVTSATAAVRGNKGQHSHTAAMGGRRMLCQSLNAEFSSAGIHVAHIVVDGLVDAPDTVGKLLGPENFAKIREKLGGDKEGMMLPEKIADTYFHISQQHRSVWTHELDLRSFSDSAWWNS